MRNDDPIYVSEHRKSYLLIEEMQDIIDENADITVIALSLYFSSSLAQAL